MKKMSVMKKIILGAVAVLLVSVAAYFAYKTIHYNLYREYKDYINERRVYEDGRAFTALTDSSQSVQGMVLAAENDILKLYINKKTTDIAVYDKRSGEITYSNPVNASDDPIASKTNKAYLQSQLIVEYFNLNRKASVFNSYDYSTSLGQVELESIDNGVRVIYTIGDLSSATGIVPEYITSERLESFLANLSEADAKYVRLRYTENSDISGFLQLSQGAKDGIATLNKLNAFLAEAGYTEDDFMADMTTAGAEDAIPISFIIPLEYRLDGDSLNASIPAEQIVEKGGGMLYRIQFLRYFGAAGTDDEGYMMVPNGSGSIINFNNGKTDAQDYAQFIYGIDPLSMEYTVLENTETARLPVFGMYYEKTGRGMFAQIEAGASHAVLFASVSGIVNSYNYVYPVFVMRGYIRLSMFGSTGNEAELPVMESDIYDTLIEVKYSFLTKEYEGYSGMANYYRERLVREGVLTANEPKEDVPFYLDIIGGVKRTAFFLGVQYLQVYPMTTFKQAGEIVDTLNNGGVNNIILNYQGWFNGGYYHDVPDKIKLVSKLGSKKDLESLSDKVEKLGGKLYGDVVFQEVTFITKRFDYQRESSRYYGGGFVASFGLVNPVTMYKTSSLGYRETLYDLLSPKFLVRYVEKFADKITDYDITGISLRDLGSSLHPDKKRTEIILREDAKDIVISQLERLSDTGKDLMISGGNSYALAYADDIIKAPLSDNPYLIIDSEIPFYEMLIHGYIDYAGTPLNVNEAYNEADAVLSMIEKGAAPRFVFTYQESNEFKYTGLKNLYSTTFSNWNEIAKRVYKEVNDALKYVDGYAIVEHKIFESGVVKITYSNGVSIYVNRLAIDAVADNKVIPAKSYEMEGTGR